MVSTYCIGPAVTPAGTFGDGPPEHLVEGHPVTVNVREQIDRGVYLLCHVGISQSGLGRHHG